jgi:hypothetical protein
MVTSVTTVAIHAANYLMRANTGKVPGLKEFPLHMTDLN